MKEREIENIWIRFCNTNDARINDRLDGHAWSWAHLADLVSNHLVFDVTVRVAHNSQSEIRTVEGPQSGYRPTQDTPPQVE